MSTKTVRPKSELLHEEWGYLPTYLIDDGPGGDGTCTLLVRHYSVVRTPKGNYHTRVKTDAMEFPDSGKMTHWIETVDARELPGEADGDPRFVPEDIRGIPSLQQLLDWGRGRVRP